MWKWLAILAAVFSLVLAIVAFINGQNATDAVQYAMLFSIIAQLEEEKR
jgi:hypothetical protein